MKMNKKLMFATFLLGVFVLGSASVLAVDPQVIEVGVSGTSGLAVSPGTINFGAIVPGTPVSLPTAITFEESTLFDSNEDMRIQVITEGVTGIFANNIDVTYSGSSEYEGYSGSLEDLNILMECISEGILPCTYETINLDATLDIPLGTPAGQKSGTITYLVTASEPIFP